MSGATITRLDSMTMILAVGAFVDFLTLSAFRWLPGIELLVSSKTVALVQQFLCGLKTESSL